MAFDLSSIAPTRHSSPPRIVLHGEEKVGKSTFFSQAPNPIFIQTEDGLSGIDTQAFPQAERYADVIEALDTLIHLDHPYKTVVLDSMDWCERLIHQEICSEEGKPTIEQCAGGYGKGYQLANSRFKELLMRLDTLNKRKGMVVGVICHSKISGVKDPLMEEYDQVKMKLHSPKSGNGIGDILNEWADIIGYAAIVKMISAREKTGFSGEKSYRALRSTGERVLHLDGSPGFVAGNRYGLPPELPLAWDALMAAITTSNQNQQEENSNVA